MIPSSSAGDWRGLIINLLQDTINSRSSFGQTRCHPNSSSCYHQPSHSRLPPRHPGDKCCLSCCTLDKTQWRKNILARRRAFFLLRCAVLHTVHHMTGHMPRFMMAIHVSLLGLGERLYCTCDLLSKQDSGHCYSGYLMFHCALQMCWLINTR